MPAPSRGSDNWLAPETFFDRQFLESQSIVKLIGLEVSASVPPLPYKPVPGVPGLVTVTMAVPDVAMAAAGTTTVS